MLFLLKNFKTIEEMARYCNRPWKLGLWLWNRVWFKEEEGDRYADYWQPPEETLKTMVGNCLAFAILARAVVKKLGYEPFLMSITKWEGHLRLNKEAHMICVYWDKKAGRYNYFSNGWLCKAGSNLTKIPKTIWSDTKMFRLYGENNKRTEQWDKIGKEWFKHEE